MIRPFVRLWVKVSIIRANIRIGIEKWRGRKKQPPAARVVKFTGCGGINHGGGASGGHSQAELGNEGAWGETADEVRPPLSLPGSAW